MKYQASLLRGAFPFLFAGLLISAHAIGQKSTKQPIQQPTKREQEKRGQQPAKPVMGPRPAASSYRTYDEVLALIGPHVITESMIRVPLQLAVQDAKSRILSKDPRARLSERAMDSLRKDLLQRKAAELLRAERVTNLNIPTEALENYLRNQVEKIVEKRRIQAGGWPQFVKNLESMGMSVQTFRKEQRSRLQRLLVSQEEVRKFLKGGELQVTPTELWNYYKDHPKDFIVTPDARLRVLTFGPLKGQSGIEVAERAKKRILAGENLDTILRELKGDIQELQVLPNSGVSKVLKFYTWDPKAKPGELSPVFPFTRGRARVLQILERRQGKKLAFKDPEVQRRILARIRDKRIRIIRLRQAWEQFSKIQAWPLDLIRR